MSRISLLLLLLLPVILQCKCKCKDRDHNFYSQFTIHDSLSKEISRQVPMPTQALIIIIMST